MVESKFNFYYPNSAFCSHSDKHYPKNQLVDSNGLTFGLGVRRCLKNFIPTLRGVQTNMWMDELWMAMQWQIWGDNILLYSI